MKLVLLIYIILICVKNCHQTLSKEDKKKGKHNATPKKSKTSIKSVIERNLVKQSFDIDEVIDNHEIYCNGKSCAEKFFHNYVMGYVTPWNKHGYNITELFAHKFTHISPVWYQITPDLKINQNDYDGDWIKRVKAKNKKLKIVPRIIFERWSREDFASLLSSEESIRDCVYVLSTLVKNQNFDGLVVEIWNPSSIMAKDGLMDFLQHLSKELHANKKLLILVIPPPFYNDANQLGIFVRADYDKLKTYIDGFSLMTYDWATHTGVIGPNSPLVWAKQCITYLADDDDAQGRYKIFMGINFYGKDYELPRTRDEPITSHPEDVIGPGYVERLKTYAPKCEWSKDWEETLCHYQRKGKQRVLLYPSLASIEQRLHLANDMNVGIAIWEIGQGLDYFYDLL